MDAVAVIGSTIAFLSAASTTLRHEDLRVEIRRSWTELRQSVTDYGVIRSILLYTILLEAKDVITRVKRHVIGKEAAEAWRMKESYTPSFNMIGVAGAIVAQIAITALSLPDLQAAHWTVQACFIISLTAGCLSVYYSCVVQLILGGLHGHKEVMNWLARPRLDYGGTQVRPVPKTDNDTEAATETPSYIDACAEVPSSIDAYVGATAGSTLGGHEHLQEESRSAFRTLSNVKRLPSFNAVLMLVAPAALLNLSLAAFLVGLGIYLGMVCTEQLSSLRNTNRNASLAVLIVYIIFTSGALLGFYVPTGLKLVESALSRTENEHLQNLREQWDRNTEEGKMPPAAAAIAGSRLDASTPPIFSGAPQPRIGNPVVPMAAAAESTPLIISTSEEVVALEAEHLAAQKRLLLAYKARAVAERATHGSQPDEAVHGTGEHRISSPYAQDSLHKLGSMMRKARERSAATDVSTEP